MIIPLVHRHGRHAVVMGGSTAGLLASRVLLEFFDHVSLIERDPFEENSDPCKRLPRARHAHGLLARGYGMMRRYLPALEESLSTGIHQGDDYAGDPGKHVPPGRFGACYA